MQLKTILNRIEHFKSFVYSKSTMIDDGDWPNRSHDRAAGQRAADLFGLRSRRPATTVAASAALRVCAVVGNPGVFSVRDAAS